jgi:cytochrome P450
VADISAQEFWTRTPEEREETFARLRAEEPVSWQRQPESDLLPQEEGSGGYWAVTRYDDVREASRAPERFSSAKGVMFEDVPQELLDASQSFLAMDDPRHKTLRALVSEGFKPRRVKEIEDGISADARTIVAELEADETGDFVTAISKRLPLMTIMRMLGVRESERERLVEAADSMVSWNDPDYLGDRQPLQVVAEGIMTLHAGASEIVAERRRGQQDDLVGELVAAEVDGQKLTDEEIAAFFVLLSVAGNDTTRHTTSQAMVALSRFAGQRAWLAEDLDGRMATAVEEFIRWASPVMTFRRTATQDTEIGGQEVSEGEKVVLFYTSANRDEEAFEDAGEFDLSRDPNRHVGFGGGGPHFCMGAVLARTQLRSIFIELLTAYPEIQVSEPKQLKGNFVNGISKLPYQLNTR